MPKTILQLMNVEGMTRENAASHLQKYRLYLKRLAGYPAAARLPLDTLQQVQQVCESSINHCMSRMTTYPTRNHISYQTGTMRSHGLCHRH